MQLRKRKIHQIPTNEYECNIKKKHKNSHNVNSQNVNEVDYNYKIDNSWVSASKVSYYMLDDPVMDYMKLSSKKNIYETNKNGNKDYKYITDILMKQGILFENKVIDFLKNTKINNSYRDFVTISKKWQDVFSIEKYKDTIYYMKMGIPIIYQAVLHDKKNKLFGSPDLLIRNDYLEFIFSDIEIPYPPLKKNFYYNMYVYAYYFQNNIQW